MQSAIGSGLSDSPGSQRRAVAVAAAAVAFDLLIVTWYLDPRNRGALALIVFAMLVHIAKGDLSTLGLRMSPKQGWLAWVRLSLWIGAAVAVCIVVGFALWTTAGYQVPIYTTSPDVAWDKILYMCFFSPTIEETIYRLAVCVPLVPLVGCWKTIAINGLLFAGLHVVYGNPSPENLVGGFFLAWAFLRSESILVPWLLHAAGNGIVLAAQVAGWYWLASGA